MITLVLIFAFIVGLYFYLVKNYDYWKKRGVKFIKPLPFLGSFRDPLFLKQSYTQMMGQWYKKYPNEKVVGYYLGTTPALLIRDPELVKRVLITDFVNFHHRGLHPDPHGIEPLLSNLFFVEGDLWRSLRQRMTPAFTSGKLKAMFPLIVERAEKLQARTLNAARGEKVIDARDLMARYTTDFIGACGFGLDADSLNDEDSAFRKLGRETFKFELREAFITYFKGNFPRPFRFLRLLGRLENQVFSLVSHIQEQRNFKPSGRNDFIDLLLECQNKGPIEIESLEKIKPDGTPDRATIELTDRLLAAQVFVFFAAGFETSSSSTSYTLHQLAHNPEVLKKVQKEIDTVLSKHENKLSYDAVKEMTYLEWTFKEGMRMFPSLGYLSRKCTRVYTFPELNLSIDEGTMIAIPVQSLQKDPQYFDNPEEFRPERFDSQNNKGANKFVYLPFGDGPRACIGERLGLMQSLAGLAALLSKFDVEPAPGSKRDLLVKPQFDIVQTVEGGIPLLK
ncbi:hypothetical protein ABMA27_005377 [Loxostege sticticalis]|uniref:unspecific monooxygenase n=1 Tax=Loxostege sticticalis TaxID=481309 RepID=A0ABR3HIY7_LOXSC